MKRCSIHCQAVCPPPLIISWIRLADQGVRRRVFEVAGLHAATDCFRLVESAVDEGDRHKIADIAALAGRRPSCGLPKPLPSWTSLIAQAPTSVISHPSNARQAPPFHFPAPPESQVRKAQASKSGSVFLGRKGCWSMEGTTLAPRVDA